MSDLFATILSSRRRKLIGSKPVFEQHEPTSESSLANIVRQIGADLPSSLQRWLLTAGYGDVNDVLSFREEWFRLIDRGELKGHVIFAQDDLGNFYSFSPEDGSIHFIARSDPEFARLATDFHSFLKEFEHRSFDLHKWIDELEMRPYDWDARSAGND